jgi:molybdate transport system substrate-binding protein
MTAPIKCIASMATRHILAELSAAHAARTGRAVNVDSMGGVDAARRVGAGEPVDIVVLASDAIARLETAGAVRPGSRTDIARSALAAAVAAGAPPPDLATAEAAMRTLVAARAIAYSTGPSGDHIVGLLRRWDILDRIGDRLVKAPPGIPVGSLVADGTAQIGFQQLSELKGLPGIAIVGPLAPELRAVTTFTAAIATRSAAPEAARDFIAVLAGADARDVYVRHGMESIAREGA